MNIPSTAISAGQPATGTSNSSKRKAVTFPNVRKLFLPDKGKILIDFDLKGADAQVVAWETNDADLKEAFRLGIDIHNHNGQTVWGDAYLPSAKPRGLHSMRNEVKRAVHGTNYGGSARTIAITLGWRVAEAEAFQRKWFAAHPGIKDWHERVYYQLQTTRTITNRFGYRVVYFDRPDGLLPEALAWVPQSTVGEIASRGAVELYKNLPYVDVLLQVHDSVVIQLPQHRFNPSTLRTIRALLTLPVPYDDPLEIEWSLKASARSWGDCLKYNWDGNLLE